MNPRNLFRSACAVPLLATAGCVSLGRPFPTDKISGIALNKTTQAELTTSYGHPYRTGVEDGDVTWTYVDEHFPLLGEPRTVDLFLRFNADGTVKSYTYNTNQ
jgi:hypothetical protein